MYIEFWYLLLSETKNDLIHKIYLKGKCIFPFNKGFQFLLKISFLTMLIAITQHTKNVDHNIDLTHKYINVIYTSHLSTHYKKTGF
jgi:hypothetical protein